MTAQKKVILRNGCKALLLHDVNINVTVKEARNLVYENIFTVYYNVFIMVTYYCTRHKVLAKKPFEYKLVFSIQIQSGYTT